MKTKEIQWKFSSQYQDHSYEVESIDSIIRGAFTTISIEGLKAAAGNNALIVADDLLAI